MSGPPPPPPPPGLAPPPPVSVSKKEQQGKTKLLNDIHKGTKLKSTKHLMNDRSVPLVNSKGLLDILIIFSHQKNSYKKCKDCNLLGSSSIIFNDSTNFENWFKSEFEISKLLSILGMYRISGIMGYPVGSGILYPVSCIWLKVISSIMGYPVSGRISYPVFCIRYYGVSCIR